VPRQPRPRSSSGALRFCHGKGVLSSTAPEPPAEPCLLALSEAISCVADYECP
jgi:hypothetical protein